MILISLELEAMPTKGAVFACSFFLIAGLMTPAAAGEYRHARQRVDWHATHDAIYQSENRIAFLEANPEIDDGYKAPIIPRARREIRRLRAELPPAHWRWVVPCCYSRRPMYIR